MTAPGRVEPAGRDEAKILTAIFLPGSIFVRCIFCRGARPVLVSASCPDRSKSILFSVWERDPLHSQPIGCAGARGSGSRSTGRGWVRSKPGQEPPLIHSQHQYPRHGQRAARGRINYISKRGIPTRGRGRRTRATPGYRFRATPSAVPTACVRYPRRAPRPWLRLACGPARTGRHQWGSSDCPANRPRPPAPLSSVA